VVFLAKLHGERRRQAAFAEFAAVITESAQGGGDRHRPSKEAGRAGQGKREEVTEPESSTAKTRGRGERHKKSGIMAEAVLTPWDKDLEPDT
jgi:hypothetical protein